MEQIKLDIIPKGLMPTCHASQYDKGRVIRLNLMDGLQGYSLTDETVVLNVRKPDNNIVTTNVDITQGNSYVDIVTTEQMTACEGDNLCELVINKGDVRIASLNFRMRVEVDPLKDGIESETEIHNLETQIADIVSDQYDSENVIFDSTPTAGHGNGYTVTSEGIKDALDAINNPDASAVNYDNTESGLTATNVQDALDEVVDVVDVCNDNFADAYDPTATYNTGSVCIYNNVLYICTADNTTGTFDPSKWTATTIDNVIGDLSQLTTTDKSSLVGAVNEVNGAITSPKDITSDYITMASGYTFISGKVYKQGKHIFGNIVLSGTLQGGNNTDTLGTIKSDYRTADPINGFCGISNGQWFTNNIGYVYIASSGGLQVATTPTGMNYAKIHIDYVTA